MGIPRNHDQSLGHGCKGNLAGRRRQGYDPAVRFVPLSPALGAEVVDLDTTAPIAEAARTELRRRFLEHHLLLVRSPGLTPEDHDRFVSCFGPLQEHRAGDAAGYVTSRADDPRSLFPEMQPLLWHNDGAYGPRPGIATSLWAVEVASTAAPTLFANVVEIIDRLPDRVLEQARRLHVLNVRDTDFNRTYERVPLTEITASDDPDRYVTFRHPVLFPAPHLGREAVIASQQMTSAVVDLPPAEGDAFLSELYGHIYAPDNVYEHHWQPGDVIIWDNIALHHARPAEVGQEARHLRRQCVDGWYLSDGELMDWTFTRRQLRVGR